MKSIEHLIWFPASNCGEDLSHCPLLRTCPVCKFRFVTARGRRQHQNGCAGTLDDALVAAQHHHQRRRHGGQTIG